jgi:hypothetical protein
MPNLFEIRLVIQKLKHRYTEIGAACTPKLFLNVISILQRTQRPYITCRNEFSEQNLDVSRAIVVVGICVTYISNFKPGSDYGLLPFKRRNCFKNLSNYPTSLILIYL